jgi:uncharacterized SAM-binding protein YcdF (DUF218 family)
MTRDNHSSSVLPAPRRVRPIPLLLGAGVLLAGLVVFLFVGDWLVAEDPLQKADAIAVLSGRLPLRATEAAKVYRDGYAPKIWLTHPSEPEEELNAIGVTYKSEDVYNAEILTRLGVPKDAILVIEPSIRNTADEIRAISGEVTREHAGTVIIVTSKVHTRRTRMLWNRLANGKTRVLVRGSSDDPFRPSRWWATTQDALDVVREVLGILNVWAGLPLRPSK